MYCHGNHPDKFVIFGRSRRDPGKVVTSCYEHCKCFCLELYVVVERKRGDRATVFYQY